MRRITITIIGITVLFLLLVGFAQVQAAVDWESGSEFFQFTYRVNPNGGIMYDLSTSYFNPRN